MAREVSETLLDNILSGQIQILYGPDGLGLFVGSMESDIANCPEEWMFVNRQTATRDTLKESIVMLREGYKN